MNVEVAALCDIDEHVLNERLDQFEKATHKRPRAFTDMRKVLEDKSIDVVSFATPNHWHALGTVWACQAGKDVYVEKPCSHTLWEGRKMVEAARTYNRIVQHGTQCRSSVALQQAVKKLREGVIGEVYMAKGLCYKWRDTIGRAQEEPVPTGVHYDLWTGPAPARPFTRNRFHYNWHWQWTYGNGDIGNQGVHQLDLARWGLGVGLPERVQSMGGHYMFSDDQETPNTQVSAFHYPGQQKLLTFEVRHWITNPEGGIGNEKADSNAVGVLFLGSEGYMEIPSYDTYRTFLGKKKEPGPSARQDGDHFANFIEAVRSRKPEALNAEIEEGHLSSALCHLANVSYRLDRTLAFDPQTEKFPDDEEANRLLSREYRPPYVIPEKV
jgi:predicted dehydrogenase